MSRSADKVNETHGVAARGGGVVDVVLVLYLSGVTSWNKTKYLVRRMNVNKYLADIHMYNM